MNVATLVALALAGATARTPFAFLQSGSAQPGRAPGETAAAQAKPERSAPASTPTDGGATDVRRVALERDPASLPRSAPERWRDFDPARLTPTDVPPAFLVARANLAEGDLPAAIGGLHAVLTGEPDYPPALHQLGVLYFQLQRYGDARTCFARYLEVVPQRVADTRGLAHALYSLGEFEAARAHYERVLAAAPDDVEARRGRALARYRLGDVEGALADLDAVLSRVPRHADAWTWKAQVLLDLEKPTESLAAAERARDLAPWSPRPWFALASALSDLGRDEESRTARARFDLLARHDQEIRRLEARLELDPRDDGSRRSLVLLLAEVGNKTALHEHVARLASGRPGDVPTLVLALDVFERVGDLVAAQAAARELERAGEDSVAAWKRLEAWYGARQDRLKQIEAGERWRRASRP